MWQLTKVTWFYILSVTLWNQNTKKVKGFVLGDTVRGKPGNENPPRPSVNTAEHTKGLYVLTNNGQVDSFILKWDIKKLDLFHNHNAKRMSWLQVILLFPFM